jgi:hypothetical protein
MALRCRKCGSSNTETRRARDFSGAAGAAGFHGAALISPAVAIAIAAALTGLFKWLAERERSSRRVVACLDCGHWESA